MMDGVAICVVPAFFLNLKFAAPSHVGFSFHSEITGYSDGPAFMCDSGSPEAFTILPLFCIFSVITNMAWDVSFPDLST